MKQVILEHTATEVQEIILVQAVVGVNILINACKLAWLDLDLLARALVQIGKNISLKL